MYLSRLSVVWIVGIFSFLAVIVSYQYAEKRLVSLSVPQDYQYFYGLAVRAGNLNYVQQLPVQIIGRNIFFVGDVSGTEAKDNLYKSIHFEPIKYGLISLYRFIPHVEILFLFYSILFFLPLLYFSYVAVRKIPGLIVLLLSLLYIFFPSSINISAENIRPYNLFAPIILITYTAILFKRPRWEQISALGALAFIREEGLFFALPLVGVVWLEAYRNRAHIWRAMMPYISVWLLAAITTVLYFVWSGYRFVPVEYGDIPSWIIPVFFLLLAITAIAAIVRITIKRNSFLTGAALLYLMPLFAFGHRIIADIHFSGDLGAFFKNLVFTFVFGRYYMPVIAIIICLYAACAAYKIVLKKEITVLLLGCIVAATLVVDFSANHGFYNQYISSNIRTADAALVWDTKNLLMSINPRGMVITDTKTMSAFVDYDNAYDFRWLPQWVSGGSMEYPENIESLYKLVRGSTHIIVSAESIPEITKIIGGADVIATVVAENNSFRIYEIKMTQSPY